MKKTLIVMAIAASVLVSCQSSTDVLSPSQLASSPPARTTAAVSTSNPDLTQAPEAYAEQFPNGNQPASLAIPGNSSQQETNPYPSIAEPEPQYVQPRTRKTYLINGLVSAVPFIGFGLTNLKKKIPDAKLYSYLSPVEGSVAIAPSVTKDIIKAHKQDPNVEVNLIGISYGANLITQIASRLNKKGIRVNYLGIIEGTTLKRIPPNVDVADNFTCTYLDCTRAKAKLTSSNSVTRLQAFKFNTSHIPMGNNKKMHNRILAQIAG